MISKTSRLLVTILGCFLSACGAGVGQLGEARFTLTTERSSGVRGTCQVRSYISPPDEQFATSGIQATINGSPAWVQQSVAAHESYVFWNVTDPGWIHVPASGLTIDSQGNHLPMLPAPAFIDIEISDGFSKIGVRAANPCALDALDFEGARTALFGTQSLPAFHPGETITLISDERGSWGTEPVPFKFAYMTRVSETDRFSRTVMARPDGNRLTLVVPDDGLTEPTSALLSTTQRAIVPAFEKCEGLAGCNYVGYDGFETVKWLVEP